jgi:hypothetical protein
VGGIGSPGLRGPNFTCQEPNGSKEVALDEITGKPHVTVNYHILIVKEVSEVYQIINDPLIMSCLLVRLERSFGYIKNVSRSLRMEPCLR